MELNIHTGLGGQSIEALAVRSHRQDVTCMVTVYTFTDYLGGKIEIRHFQHGYFPETVIQLTGGEVLP
jgi:hypothetical protein